MDYVRTPGERFLNLPGYPFEPNYINVDCKDGPLILCMHGQPAWSYLYRKMIPGFVDAGMRKFPSLVPVAPDNIAIADNRNAWKTVFEKWEKPFLTLFGDSDIILSHLNVKFQERIPGAKGQAHQVFKGAGHFIQEQAPDELVEHTINFIRNS